MTQDEIIEMAREAGFKMENSAAVQAAKAFYKLATAKAAAKGTWVGLTNEEIDSYFEDHGYSPSEGYYPVIKDVEAKFKEKNF